MRVQIDTGKGTLIVSNQDLERKLDLFGIEAFELMSELWLKMSWNQKYSYTFTWMGRPIIQHPEDLVRLQEVIYQLKPDVIIETGVAHGGSLIFYASLFKAMGKGRVIGVDVEIREHNRKAIEAHELFPFIRLVEGDSTAPEVVAAATHDIGETEVVLVILDSNHSKAHVAAELAAYSSYVTPGSYIVATDGIMQMVADAPRGRPEWAHDNPIAAVSDFLAVHQEFELVQPEWLFNESELKKSITGWPNAWLRRKVG